MKMRKDFICKLLRQYEQIFGKVTAKIFATINGCNERQEDEIDTLSYFLTQLKLLVLVELMPEKLENFCSVLKDIVGNYYAEFKTVLEERKIFPFNEEPITNYSPENNWDFISLNLEFNPQTKSLNIVKTITINYEQLYLLGKLLNENIEIKDKNYFLSFIKTFADFIPAISSNIPSIKRELNLEKASKIGSITRWFEQKPSGGINGIVGFRGTLLHMASNLNFVDVVEFLSCNGADLNAKNYYDETPLHVASARGYLPIVKVLVSNGANVNAKDYHGKTPLDFASEKGHSEIEQYLLSNNADVNAINKNFSFKGETIIDYSEKNDDDFMSSYLEFHSEKPLLRIVKVFTINNAQLSLLQQLSNKNIEIETKKIVSSFVKTVFDFIEILPEISMDLILEDTNQISSINTWFNSFQNQEYLEINSKNENGKSLLHFVFEQGFYRAVFFLIRNGADVDAKNNNGYTPLCLELDKGHLSNLSIVELLISKGADVNVIGNDGRTPLIITSRFGDLPIAELLISKGADVNAKDNDGYTPLIMTSRFSNLSIMEFLISKGADVNARENNGYTPLIMTSRYGCLPIMQLLISKGADVNAKDNCGYTPLHHASMEGHAPIVELLISEGAEVNAEDDNGYTPLCHALKKGHVSVVDLLANKGADEAKWLFGIELYSPKS